MRQIGWFKHGLLKVCASQRHWSATLLSVSILSMLLATALLIVDGWMDALAIYLASALTLSVLVSRFAEQQTAPQVKSLIDGSAHDAADPRPGLIFEQTP